MAMNKDFGGFELKQKIGSGGMASVYLAVQKSLQRRVVLKILYPHLAEDEKLVQRQAFAGLLWGKQIYLYDVARWLDGDNPAWPPPASRLGIRNAHWKHLNSMRVISMPDKWEYPWFAAWDLAFHAVPLALVDPQFAKEQLWVLLFEQFLHPSGQIPAYEWAFSDMNPPVHAWAVWRVYNMDRLRSGTADRDFLERCFHKVPPSTERIVHVCCGYPDRLDAEDDPKAPNAAYLELAGVLDEVAIDAVSIEDAERPNDLALLERLARKKVILGVIAIARSRVEEVEEVRDRLRAAKGHIDAHRLLAAPDCGLGLLGRDLARAKLEVLAAAAHGL